MRWPGWRRHPEEKNGGGCHFFSGGLGLARRRIPEAYRRSQVGGKRGFERRRSRSLERSERVGGERVASAAGIPGMEGWDQKWGSVSLGVRVGAIRLARREIRRSWLGAVRVRAGCASETLPTAMSPGCIG